MLHLISCEFPTRSSCLDDEPKKKKKTTKETKRNKSKFSGILSKQTILCFPHNTLHRNLINQFTNGTTYKKSVRDARC